MEVDGKEGEGKDGEGKIRHP